MKIQSTNNIKLQKINICVVGPSKSGKTTLTKTIKGKPLLLNADKGTLSLCNDKIAYVSVTKWAEVVEFMKYITTSPDFVKRGYNWVVFDSISAIAQILTNHLEEKGVTGFEFWGEYAKLMGGLMATTRDTERFNSLSIFEMQEKENSNGLLEKKFGLQGSMLSKVPFFYDFVFATKKIPAKKDKAAQYVLQTTNKDGYSSLGCRGVELNEYEPANISHIVSKLTKGVK